jgi:uncharacterized protein YneF (UPF0154 family)
MTSAAQSMELTKANPEAVADLIRQMGEQAGTSTALVSGEAVVEYFQSDAYDPETSPLAPFEQAAREAALAGGDVAIPIEALATKIAADQSAWAAIQQDTRITPGGMTPREARAFEERLQDIIDETLDLANEEVAQQAGEADRRSAAVGKMTSLLQEQGMFSRSQAEQYAEAVVGRMFTRAQRLGRGGDAVDQAMQEFQVETVLPDDLAEAVAQGEQDAVIAALRGDPAATPEAQRAAEGLRALLEEMGQTPTSLDDDQIRQIIAAMQRERSAGRAYTEEDDNAEFSDEQRAARAAQEEAGELRPGAGTGGGCRRDALLH